MTEHAGGRARLLLATRNAHKAGEISALLSGSGVELSTLADFPEIPAVVEDGKTLEENACKKALLPALASRLWTLADDTGLEVTALDGAPGVRSARYAGPGCDFEANNRKLLKSLEGVPAAGRKAVFRCVVALASPAGQVRVKEGRLEGVIAEAPAGSHGFGYDPLFVVPELGRTLAEMTDAEKNSLSHRARAVAAMLPVLKSLLLLFLAVLPARAGKTADEGQKTFWDEMMEAQARRTMVQGAVQMDRGDYSGAVREFAKAVVANPRDASAHRMLGVAYYWSGQVDRAETEFQESLRLEPANAQSQLLMGIVQAWKGEPERAFDYFKEASRLEPDRADITMNLGSIEESLGLIPEALVHFRRAVELDSSHPLYHFQLGMLYRRLGRDDEAVSELNQAIKKYPNYQDAMLELGATYERMGQRKDALDLFKRAVRIKTRDSVARFRLARAWLLEGRARDARDALREVFHLTPADPGSGLALSLSYGGRTGRGGGEGNGRKAGQQAKPEGPEGPLDVLARNLARIPLEQEAVLKVDMAFIPRPKLVRSAPGEPGSALKQALERSGKLPAPSVLAAQREYRLPSGSAEQREAAIQKVLSDIRGVLGKAPPDAETRFGMQLSFSDKSGGGGPGGGAPSPSDDKKPTVSYNPHDVGNDLGLWVMGTGWMALVEEVLTPFGERASHPDEASWWVLEGIGSAILGDSRGALDAFTRALQLDPKEELAYLGRGVALVIGGDEKGAAEAYRRALALNPKDKTAAEGLKWLMRGPASGRK